MIGFIGAGRMAQAMFKGVLKSGMIRANEVLASDPDGRVLESWEKMGAQTSHCNREVAKNQDVIVLSVKPNMVRRTLREVYPFITKDHLVISIAAGISLDTLQQELPNGSRVVRLMPNTPALVQSGVSVFSRGTHTRPDDGELVERFASSFGICEEMAEKHLDAVTGLSASGPGFMFMALEALSDGGVKMGLTREAATKLAAQTMIGSAKMVMESGKHPGELKDSVCSPSGTTISAVYELEKAGFRFALINAVQAASRRAYELGLMDNYDTVSEVTGAAHDYQGRLSLMKVGEKPAAVNQPTHVSGQKKRANTSRSLVRRSHSRINK